MRLCGGSGEDEERVWSVPCKTSSWNNRVGVNAGTNFNNANDTLFFMPSIHSVQAQRRMEDKGLAGTLPFRSASHHWGFNLGSAACLLPW